MKDEKKKDKRSEMTERGEVMSLIQLLLYLLTADKGSMKSCCNIV